MQESLRREAGGSETNPLERMAAMDCPAREIDEILAEIDDGRR